MKHFILLFFFSLVLGSQVTAQLASPVELTRLAVEPEVIDATDVDMDGDIDIVSHSLPSAEIVWFENFGQGNFDRPKVLVAIPRGDVNFKLVDLDGDGDEDLLIASDYSSLILYENDGQGNYGNQSILMEGVDILGGLYTADADFDGDLDIVEMDITNEEIGVIYNLGEGNFSSFTSLMSDPEYIDYIDDIKLADVNSNGSIDILIHREPGLSFMNITWSQGPGFFAENEFDALASATWPSAVLVSDLDGDNDQDFIVGYEAQSGLTVLENIGGGNFTYHFQWFTNLSSKHESLNDLDGDGDVDYIFSDGLTLNSNGYSLYWLENLGDFMFGPPEIISSQQYLPRVDDICVADLNGNGLNCIVTLTRTFSQPSGQKDEISWFDNFGEGSFGPENVLTTANSVPFDINFADVDQDGAID
ncbi:MAG: VCBS repeat-containing protein, partial [Cryomorphaceae bacterium]